MMSFRRTASVVLRYFYLLRGSPARFIPLFAWVAIDILLWGFISRYLNSVAAPRGAGFVPSLLGAVLLWDFFSRVMHGMATAFFEDVWSRNFLNVFASPLTVPEYLTGLVSTTVVTSLVGLVVMIVLAAAVFGLSFASFGLALLPFLMTLFLFGIALGVLGCGIVLRFGPASEWFVWPIPALISPFVGVFYPLSTLPAWMRAAARLLPPSYVFEAVRSMVAGGPFPAAGLLCGAGLAVLHILLAYAFFARVFRQAVRTGLIARYSAESVG